jgi:hypothetical protein
MPEDKKNAPAGKPGANKGGNKNASNLDNPAKNASENHDDKPDYSSRESKRDSMAESFGAMSQRPVAFLEEDPPINILTEAEALGKALARDTPERVSYLIENGLIHHRRHKDLLASIRKFISDQGSWDEITFAAFRHHPETWTRNEIFELRELHGDHDGNGKPNTWEPALEVLRDTTRRRGLYQLANQIHVYSRSPGSTDTLEVLQRTFQKIYDIEEAISKPDQSLIQSAGAFIEEDISEAPILIDGMLRRGEKMMISGPSKAGKSWAMLNMFMSMGSGFQFWGKECNKSDLLFLNLELRPKTMQRRLCQVMRELERLGMDPGMPKGCHVLNLREWIAANPSLDPFEFVEKQVKRSGIQFSGIFLDPLYKVYGDRNENDLSDMKELWGRIEALGNSLDAAMIISHHFAKGSASAKDHIDRGAGSGGHAREVDVFMTMSPHEDEGCYTIESTLRDWAPMPSFVVEWDWPLMTPIDKDPTRLRGKGGPPVKFSVEDLRSLIDPNGTAEKDLIDQATEQFDVVSKTVKNKLKLAQGQNKVFVSELDGKLYLTEQ